MRPCPRSLLRLAALSCLLLAACGDAGRINVLFITIDTLRADHLGCYGYVPARTPNIDRLAREGVRAEDAVTAAPITMPAHASLMTGLFPPAHGVRDNGVYSLPEPAVTLAERFQRAGYRTHAIVSAIVLNRRYNLDQGFDEYDDDLWAENQPKLFMIRDRPASRTAERAVAWLRERRDGARRSPFFLWVHFFDPHQPYEAPPRERNRSPTPYDAEIAAADAGVGRVLDELRRGGELDRTLVVLTADHGESLGEHGEKTHAIFIYDATMHVPLILRLPGALPADTVYRDPVRSVDVAPTILGAAGLPGGDEAQGVDLFPALAGKVAPPRLPQYLESLVSEVGFGMAPLVGVRAEGFKWIRAPKPELYDLERDPRELTNLFPRQREPAGRLERALSEILDDSRERALEAPENPLDSETEEALQALGYLAADAAKRAMGGMDPKDGIVLYNKAEEARHLAQRQRWAESEALLREVLAETPGNITARNVLALTLLRQSRGEEAREQYLRSLADDPGQSRVYGMLGALALGEGDLEAARRHYERALEITPDFVEAMSNLGVLASLRGDSDQARRWHEKALMADPRYPRAHRRLADLHYERGEFADALAQYERALAITPSDFDARIQAGNSARRLGREDEARDHFERARQIRPDSWVPDYNLACLAALAGDNAAALERLRECIRLGLESRRLVEEDPDLRALVGTPELAAILATLGNEESPR